MNKYIRDILLIGIYGCILICQLSFSAYLINKKDKISEILHNYKNITECKNDAIYRLKDGALIDNTMAILVSSSVVIGSFLLIIFNKYILNKYVSKTDYESLNYDDGFIKHKLINIDKYDMAIHIIFIMAILCFIISSGIQFVFQLNNISHNCLYYIDKNIDNFYVVYEFMICTTFISSYALLFIMPCFL